MLGSSFVATEIIQPPKQTEAGKYTGQVWGDFTMQHLLGKGGMGEVYFAKQVSLGRNVAIKVLSPELSDNEQFLKRFHLEARAVAQLSHPNVIQVYAAGEHQGSHYFAMEFIEGADLSQRIRMGWRPNVRESVNLISQAARGLAAASSKGLIHRDIKPGNMMLANDGTLKLMDFGLVRQQGEEMGLTMTGTVMGTASYLSPEQGQGAACDIRTDIYALGIVFYELVTGSLPFRGDSMSAVIYQHIHTAPRPPKEIDPLIPDDAQAIVLKCMQKDPQDRYASPQQLAADLDALAQGAALQMSASELRALRRGAMLGRAQAFPGERRRGPLFAGLGLVALLLAAGAAWLFLQESASPSLSGDGSSGDTASLVAAEASTQDDRPSASQAAAETAAAREAVLEHARELARLAETSDPALQRLRVLASEHAQEPLVAILLETVLEHRQEHQQERLGQLLHSASAAQDAGDFDLAEATYQEVLAIDPQHTQARMGLQQLGQQRQHTQRSAELVDTIDQALQEHDLEQTHTLIEQLQQHDPSHAFIAQARQQAQDLQDALAREEAQRQQQAEAAAEAQRRQAQADALAAVQAALDHDQWSPQQQQQAEAALNHFTDLAPDNEQLAHLQQHLARRAGTFQAEKLLAQFDQVLADGAMQDLPALVEDVDYRDILRRLAEDAEMVYRHTLREVELNDRGHVTRLRVDITHALSIMPQRVLPYVYEVSVKQSGSDAVPRLTITRAMPAEGETP